MNPVSFKTSKILKLKKYLFLISVIFLFFTFWSLLYNYLYSDSKTVAVKWWTLSEAIIWNFPHLNPLKQSSWNDKYIIWLLYRSLLIYDLEEGKIKSDIASCDINNLLYIECYLENNLKWSNWGDITTKDIVTTFKILKNSNINPIMKSILEETNINQGESKIIFSNTKKDINFLNVFFQPIMPESVTNKLWEEDLKWNFSHLDWIYSWKYVINSVNQDDSLWITKITLEKNNNYYKNDLFIDKLIIKIFNDNSHFLKFKDSINLFNDKNNLIWDSMTRLKTNEYILPQYVWLFLNYNKLKNKNLRSFILNEINRNNLLKILWDDNFKKVINPYITDINIDENSNKSKNIESILKEIWYYKKSELKAIKEKSEEKIMSDEIKIEIEKNWGNFNEKSKIVVLPNWIEKYNFVSKDNILLKWNVENDTEAVYINNYRLRWFSPWQSEFYYRLKESYNTINTWENEYEIYFEKNGNKKLIEKLVFFYDKDNQKLEKIENEFWEERRKLLEEISSLKEDEYSNKNREYMKKFNSLDDNLFYNEGLEKLTFNLIYINSEKNIEDTAMYIKRSLKEIWIEINIVPISIDQLSTVLSEEEYDMILAWINLWYFDFNIFPYFHSSQAENGYNFSNFKKLSLDILLEELKWNKFSKTKTTELEKKVLDILKDEQIVKILYTPILRQLVDKNIKNYIIPKFIPEKSLRREALSKSYISEKKIINFENKWFIDFFKFLFKIIGE